MRLSSKNTINIFFIFALLFSFTSATSSATSASRPLVGKTCLKSEVGKSVVYKASMGVSYYSSHRKSFLRCTKYLGKLLWLPTLTLKSTNALKLGGVNVVKNGKVTSKTKSAGQTVAVNTNKVPTTIAPTVAASPTPSQTAVGNPVTSPDWKDPLTLTPQIPDWNGFIAPKVTFDKIVFPDYVDANGLLVHYIGGGTSTTYNWNLTPQFKLTSGNYLGEIIGNYTLYKTSDVVYQRDNLVFGVESSVNTPANGTQTVEVEEYFKPFNWTPNSYGDPTIIWAPGYETDKVISYVVNIPYAATDCQK